MISLTLPYTLVVCEKPDAARRIAHAIGTSSFREISALESIGRSGIPSVFSVTDRHNEHFVVCSAIGHLYGLVDVNGNRSIYPVFDVKWMPILKRTATRSEHIIKTISLLSNFDNLSVLICACINY